MALDNGAIAPALPGRLSPTRPPRKARRLLPAHVTHPQYQAQLRESIVRSVKENPALRRDVEAHAELIGLCCAMDLDRVTPILRAAYSCGGPLVIDPVVMLQRDPHHALPQDPQLRRFGRAACGLRPAAASGWLLGSAGAHHVLRLPREDARVPGHGPQGCQAAPAQAPAEAQGTRRERRRPCGVCIKELHRLLRQAIRISSYTADFEQCAASHDTVSSKA